MSRTKDERLKYCQGWLKKLNAQYRDLNDDRRTAQDHLKADPNIVAVIDGRSRITTNDMQDAIDMAKPDILETIAGIDEPLKLDPDDGRYVEQVAKLQVLGNAMIKRKNPWFRICNDFLDDSMVLKFGCIKYRFIEEENNTVKYYEDLEDVELQAKLSDFNVTLKSQETLENGKVITVLNIKTEDEYVRLDAVPSERIKFPFDVRNFEEAPMVIEEVCLYEHEYIKMYGQKFFDKVEEIRESLENDKRNSIYEERFSHLGALDQITNHFYDKDRGKYRAYESYFWEGTDAWVMTWVGDQIAIDEENKYGKPPYRGGSPFLVAHSLIGKGYLDCIGEIQRERTYIKRLITDIISQNAFRRFFGNPEALGLDIGDYENNSAMNAFVKCTGQSPIREFLVPEEKVPLGQEFLSYWELLSVEKDAHIPTPRAYAGLEGAQDERTYRGKQLKVNQASKKVLMMMRVYMEEVFGPLFQDVLDCLAKFMKKKTIVRYLNQDYDISPDEIVCKYALIVNVGLGSHDKQDLIVKLQQLIGLAMQEMQTGIITPQNLWYMNMELVKAMGFLNTTDFVTDPKVKETVMELIQEMGSLLQVMGQNPQMQQMVAQIAPGFQQKVMQVMQALGVQQEPDKGGKNAQGTQPGEQPARIPDQPSNQANPQTQVSGNGFFA